MPKFEVKPNDNIYEIESDHFIEITEGKFAGFHLLFGELRFQGQDEDGNGRVAFNYDLLSYPEDVILNDELKQELELEIGEVLHNIMTEIFAQEENEIRDVNTEPTDSL